MAPPSGSRRNKSPAWVWLIVLSTVFTTEAGVMILLAWIFPDRPSPWLEAGLDSVLLTIILAPLLWWLLVRPLQEVNRLRNDFLADLFTHIEADRRQTAHDLHDGVGQSLTLLVSGLRSAHETINDPDVARRCRELQHLAQQALVEVKRLALGLRPSLLDDLGLAPALERLTADVRGNHPIEIAVTTEVVACERLPGAVETAVFRIVQEALANVVQHSGATAAQVALHRQNGNLIVEITDNGKGISEAAVRSHKPGHLGLSGMRERATLLGGEFSVGPISGSGTRVTARFPIQDTK
ncbi:MAG: sensor histidine kinase [Gemmataceae bacterium]